MRKVRSGSRRASSALSSILFGMQLQVNPLLDAHRHDLLHISGAGTEGQTIERVQRAPLIVLGWSRLVLLISQHLRNGACQAETEKTSGEPASRPKRMTTPRERQETLLIINPEGRKRLLEVVTKEKNRYWTRKRKS